MTPKETVMLDELRAKCRMCSHEFISVQLPDLQYGDMLLRSRDGEIVSLLHCLDNPVFDVCKSLVEQLAGDAVDELLFAKMVVTAIGVTCDQIDGRDVSVTQGVVCPSYRGSDVNEFDFKPPRMAAVELPLATHCRWRTLSDAERLAKISAVLTATGMLPAI